MLKTPTLVKQLMSIKKRADKYFDAAPSVADPWQALSQPLKRKAAKMKADIQSLLQETRGGQQKSPYFTNVDYRRWAEHIRAWSPPSGLGNTSTGDLSQ